MPRSTKMRGMCTINLVLAAAFLWPSPTAGRAEPNTHTLTCGPEKTIGQAIKTLKPGDTLLVSGTCNENVSLGQELERITLDGQGTATINGDSSAHAVSVTGRGITIRGFTITGGSPQAVSVTDGGSAVIDGNTIQYAARNGIAVFRNSSADIINNTIQNNPLAGIAIQSNSSARIGWVGLPTIGSARRTRSRTMERRGFRCTEAPPHRSSRTRSRTMAAMGSRLTETPKPR